MYKIITIVGTRPEIIKMSLAIKLFDKFTNHILIHSGQNYDYELNEVFFKDLEIRKPDYFLNASGKNAAQTIGNIIKKADNVLRKEKPDAILLYGDTNSCLSVIAAKKLKIPIFHMEAGNRSFDERIPEETNRKILDHLSDINLVLTEHARRYLILEGIKPETIFKTGSHMKEVLNYYNDKINKSKILESLRLKSKNYFLISIHREENVDKKSNLISMLKTFNKIASTYKCPLIVSTHPRTKDRLNKLHFKKLDNLIKFEKPFNFTDYMKLQINSKCVLSDSGTITEETSILNFPSIMLRNSHERPEGMDQGTLIMSGLNEESVLNAISVTINSRKDNKKSLNIIPDYDVELVSYKILNIVLSYINYVNKSVWKI
tara:strand:+ start:1157 stop:2281 length:1125 start_codon:yes stop_codon:yes gene_type:complete